MKTGNFIQTLADVYGDQLVSHLFTFEWESPLQLAVDNLLRCRMIAAIVLGANEWYPPWIVYGTCTSLVKCIGSPCCSSFTHGSRSVYLNQLKREVDWLLCTTTPDCLLRFWEFPPLLSKP